MIRTCLAHKLCPPVSALLLLLLPTGALGQGALDYESWTLESHILGESRTIIAEVPEACREQACPLTVVLDAEFLLPVTAGVQHLLSHRFVRSTRPTVLVGVLSTDRLRDTTPTATERFPTGGGAFRFLDFLVDELVPAAEARYATSGDRVLLGHSGSGLVSLLALIEAPGFFAGIAALDPSADWDDAIVVRELAERVGDGTAQGTGVVVFDTYRLKPVLGELVRVFEGAPDELVWSTAVHEGETHQSMLIPALRRTLPLLLPTG